MDPRVRDVEVFLGSFGRWTPLACAANNATGVATRIPGVSGLLHAGLGRMAGSSTGIGPDAHKRAGVVSIAVARTLDGVGRELSSVRVEGPSPYDLTAELLAWAAAMLLTRQEKAVGALGPADAFGLDALVAGCSDIGLRRVA